MFTLIVYILSGSVQTVQIDGFSSNEKCQDAFVLMSPLFDKIANSDNQSIVSYCIDKGN